MRGSGWLLPTVAVIAWLVCIAWPVVAASQSVLSQQASGIEIRSAFDLLLTSSAWAAGVALGAMIIGWLPGRLLGQAISRRGFVPLAAIVLVPICLPAYVIFYAWWQSWPAESATYQWLIGHGWIQQARLVTLYLGLLCWSWPLVSLCVAGSVAATPAHRDELMQLDGAGFRTRLADRLRCDRRGLLLGGLLVFLATLNNTTCFDLAEVFTFANEVRAIRALGANSRDVLIAAWPGMLLAIACGCAVWVLLRGRGEQAVRTAAASRFAAIFTAGAWIASVVVPVAWFTFAIASTSGSVFASLGEFTTLYSRSAAVTLAIAVTSALVATSISIGFAALWSDHRRWLRALAGLLGLTWLIFAVLPGTIIGVALEAAYNRMWLADVVYRTPIILIIAHLASFGFLAALIGRWAALSEPPALRDMRRLDGASSLVGLLRSSWPRLLAAAAPTFAITMVFAIGEIPVTAQVNPPHRPGAGPLALTLLNDMHYQRPQTVMIASLGMILLGIVAAFATAIVWRYMLSRRRLEI